MSLSSWSALTCADGKSVCGYAEGDELSPQKQKAARRLVLAMTICGVFMLAELVGGYYAHSLAVMSDAAHLLSDLGAFLVSLLTLRFSGRRAAETHSFGYHRLEVVGALFSVATLWLVTGVLLTEASARIRHPEVVNGPVMTGIAIGGVVVNLVLVLVLRDAGGHGHSHGGLSGGEGGCGHSHGAPAAPSRAEVATTAPWTRSVALVASSGGHGHSHAGGVCGGVRAPLLDPEEGEASSSEASSSAPAAPFPAGAVFFTRGRLPLPLQVPVEPPPPPPPEPEPQPEPAACGEEGEPADLNMRGAYLHVLGDLLQSLGVLAVGAIVWARPELHVLDPVLTFVFSALVLATTSRLLRDVVDVIMERVPRGVSSADISAQLAALPGVAGVHDLHVWLLMPGKTVLTVHVTAAAPHTPSDVLSRVQRSVAQLGIQHATVQVEAQQ